MQAQPNGASASFVPFQPGQSPFDFILSAPVRAQGTASYIGSKLAFRDTEFDVVDRDGRPWLQAAQIANALGYAREDAISRIYARNANEFTPCMTETVKLTVSGNLQKEVRIFSLRGAHLLGMFARTERAAEFRHWVLDVLDREVELQRQPKPPQAPILDIFATGRWIADVNESGWPQLTRIPDDAVFAFLEDAEAMARLIDDVPMSVLPDVLRAAAARLAGEASQIPAIRKNEEA